MESQNGHLEDLSTVQSEPPEKRSRVDLPYQPVDLVLAVQGIDDGQCLSELREIIKSSQIDINEVLRILLKIFVNTVAIIPEQISHSRNYREKICDILMHFPDAQSRNFFHYLFGSNEFGLGTLVWKLSERNFNLPEFLRIFLTDENMQNLLMQMDASGQTPFTATYKCFSQNSMQYGLHLRLMLNLNFLELFRGDTKKLWACYPSCFFADIFIKGKLSVMGRLVSTDVLNLLDHFYRSRSAAEGQELKKYLEDLAFFLQIPAQISLEDLGNKLNQLFIKNQGKSYFDLVTQVNVITNVYGLVCLRKKNFLLFFLEYAPSLFEMDFISKLPPALIKTLVLEKDKSGKLKLYDAICFRDAKEFYQHREIETFCRLLQIFFSEEERQDIFREIDLGGYSSWSSYVFMSDIYSKFLHNRLRSSPSYCNYFVRAGSLSQEFKSVLDCFSSYGQWVSFLFYESEISSNHRAENTKKYYPEIMQSLPSEVYGLNISLEFITIYENDYEDIHKFIKVICTLPSNIEFVNISAGHSLQLVNYCLSVFSSNKTIKKLVVRGVSLINKDEKAERIKEFLELLTKLPLNIKQLGILSSDLGNHSLAVLSALSQTSVETLEFGGTPLINYDSEETSIQIFQSLMQFTCLKNCFLGIESGTAGISEANVNTINLGLSENNSLMQKREFLIRCGTFLGDFTRNQHVRFSLPLESVAGLTYRKIRERHNTGVSGWCAFFMASNPRCGANSPASVVPQRIMKDICEWTLR